MEISKEKSVLVRGQIILQPVAAGEVVPKFLWGLPNTGADPKAGALPKAAEEPKAGAPPNEGGDPNPVEVL